MKRGTPSRLSMVDGGATIIWERWDSLLGDGTVNSGEMTSFNHYALSSIDDWMHRLIRGTALWNRSIAGSASLRCHAHSRWRRTGTRAPTDSPLPNGASGTVSRNFDSSFRSGRAARWDTALGSPHFLSTVPMQ